MTPDHDPTKTYTREVKEAITDFVAFMEEEHLSDTDAAAVLGCHTTTLQRTLRLQYRGRADNLAAKMAAHMEVARQRKLAPLKPPFVETSVSERVWETLDVALVERTLAVVMGGTGIGKTEATRAYLRQITDGSTAYLEALPCESLAAFAARLATAVGADAQKSAAATVETIVQVLGSGRDWLVVVDEGDYLDMDTLQALRMIQERAGIGMVWVVTGGFLETLRKRKSSMVNQVLGRIARIEWIDQAHAPDIEAVVAHLHLNKNALGVLARHSQGEIRRAINLIREAQRVNGEGITGNTIQKAARRLMAKVKG